MKHGDPNALVCTVAILLKNVSAMFLGCISYNGTGTLTPVQGNIDSGKYIEVLDQHLWPVITKEYPNGDWVFQEDNCPVHV